MGTEREQSGERVGREWDGVRREWEESEKRVGWSEDRGGQSGKSVGTERTLSGDGVGMAYASGEAEGGRAAQGTPYCVVLCTSGRPISSAIRSIAAGSR